jgi:hypothetical protein
MEEFTEEIINLINSHDNDYDLKDSLRELLSKHTITKTNG